VQHLYIFDLRLVQIDGREFDECVWIYSATLYFHIVIVCELWVITESCIKLQNNYSAVKLVVFIILDFIHSEFLVVQLVTLHQSLYYTDAGTLQLAKF